MSVFRNLQNGACGHPGVVIFFIDAQMTELSYWIWSKIAGIV